jgi:4-hydroxybenzoate polyprenyltransferase
MNSNALLHFAVLRRTCAVSALARAITVARPHHWAKNLLVFAPIGLGHYWTNPGVWPRAVLCFAAFSALASAVYIFNDLLDREADRKHASKRQRPIASGAVTASMAAALCAAFLLCGAVIAWWLPAEARWILAGYVGAAVLYSGVLKAYAVVDVLALGSFYALRVMAGGSATEITISPWTLAFCMFVFFSIALAKRYVEVNRHGPSERRGYRESDAPVLLALGVGTGLLAVQVLALYIYSPEVRQLYARPELLWLMCPVLLGWIARMWLLAGRGELNDDPLMFALRDKGSYAVAACAVIILAAATFAPR